LSFSCLFLSLLDLLFHCLSSPRLRGSLT
jgi:hypothetical protein